MVAVIATADMVMVTAGIANALAEGATRAFCHLQGKNQDALTWIRVGLRCPRKHQKRSHPAMDLHRIGIIPLRRANGRNFPHQWSVDTPNPEESHREGAHMHSVIYLVGLIVVVMLILSALGLR